MADESQVTNLLCEAMEYLTKLGSNLRSRSESLKEKKIRKEKLRNSHAIQKAAKKVLLICELSKKSLQNVENGMKGILERCDILQKGGSDGGKPSSTDKDSSSSKRIMISGKQYTLKMPRNVNLGHFKSVKVLAKSMPLSMMDHYPVYHKCKLYSLRKRKDRTESNESSKIGNKVNKQNEKDEQINIKSSVEGTISDKIGKDSSFQSNKSKTETHIKKEDRNVSNKKKHSDIKKKVTIISSDEDNESRGEMTEESQKEPKEDKEQSENDSGASDIKKKSIKPNKSRKLIDDSSDSEKDISHKNIENRTETSTTRDTEQETGILKNIACESNYDQTEEQAYEADKADQKNAHVSKSVEHTENSSVINSDPETNKVCDVPDGGNENEKNVVGDQSDTATPVVTKSLIKCVNINKLLKPDVLQKDNKNVVVHMNSKHELKTKIIDTGILKSNINNKFSELKRHENFWELKRQEVKYFVPKKFKINIHRLPSTFDSNFLLENNLKKITHNGSVVCELSKDANTDKDIAGHSNSNEYDNAVTPSSGKDLKGSVQDTVSNKAKTALLDDSDIDNPLLSDTLVDETKKSKMSLLNDSESDKDKGPVEKENTSMDCSMNKAESVHVESDSSKAQPDLSKQSNEDPKSKENENAETIPEKEKSSTLETQDQDLAKSSLLNDSSGSDLESCSKKRKREEDDTPQSRRKHIMESMHAKKMLLTYSSSSDTEDEQLKNVIKDIKESLMKEIGSDEEATKESVKKKLLSSSESEEDILKRVKKKTKKARTKSPSSKKEKTHESCSESKSSDAAMKNDENNDQPVNEHSNSSNGKMGRSREKPGGSSSQNSDTQDDKDIEGLTNLKSLTKTRRRRGSSSDAGETPDTSSLKSQKKMPKTPLITGEGLLEAPESSDGPSGAESEGLEEDLPPVTLPGLNGGAVDFLAKDDLLRESESDSSTSKDKSSDTKKDDSDSETVKARRRKANAISSDSEAGSSRRKANEDKDVKMSDFEDSEDDGSEPVKRSKRKKNNDSDASAGSSNEGKKKRRRIKEMNDSDMSGSDSETEGKSKHGRKNIRKVMGKNQLEEATKKAAREEKERLARIVERQKMYNNVDFDESGKPDEVVLDKVVLDFDPDTKEPLIEVDRGLVKKLKPHQANGIKFMWDACFESVKRIKKDRGSGCILAHCMGLGKTLQVVSLTHTLLTHSDLTGVSRVLVVCPLSTVLNWVNEFRMWLKHAERDYEVDVYELSKYKQNSERAFQLSQWFTHGGVCVLGYEMFRNLSADNNKKFKKKMLRQFQESLVDPGPELVVCDEGHLLKNEKTSLSQSMNRVKTHRRIVLTGTPLQNNLKEYYCMVQFVKPNLLGKYNEYLNRFVNPITNGQYTDSTEHDIRVMKRRSHVLHKMLDGSVQRRDYGVLAPFLPPKHEYVLFITLTEVQIKLYQHYLDNYSRRPLPGKSSGFLFPDFQSLQRIWTHPLVLKYNSERYEIMQQKKREREEEDSEGSLADFIDDDSTPDESSTEESSGDLSDMSDDSRKKSKKKKSLKKSKTKDKDSKAGPRRGTRANPIDLEDPLPDPDILEVKNENPTEWWIPLVTEDEIEDMRNSRKLVLLFEILRQCEAIGDKLLVFSQSLYSLDLIEHFLGKVDEATQEGRIDEKLGGHVGSWSPGVDYFRLDGSTSCENRSIWCKNFNREDNPRARLFLISTRAGGLGINLVAANRVVIFDVSWNPSHDVQSIFRVYRFGQKKPCYVYRFLAMGTMEEKIYERQVTKQAISKRVIDEQQIDRHYAENDLAELYKFEPRPPAPRPVPLVPKDRLFAEMLKDHEAAIYKFHEHDSLLENKEEETLSEEERKAAWEDFENEKNRPPPAPFPNWPMHNGMVPSLVAQQQQQLAYAALAQMLRKDMPNLSDENIRNMLPIIYGTNPGLMQKLSDMYKYAQPGMMNPGMMNPMNAAGAGGMGGGGSSGLQYEPPWQRQQQQQQQLRLQQLMQHQNQMGAKFYAGGLGSRDPVAMALQQQRAREIMLGGGGGRGGGAAAGGGGRPRGRPPLQPRAPPHPNDVVNLDSD